MKKFKRIIFITFLCLSQTIVSEPTLNEVIASQNLSKKLSQPICPKYKLSGSLESANVLGVIATLGLSAVGSFECAFYVGYEGRYPSDCNELLCRAQNQEVIINNAKHVINMSNIYLNDESLKTSTKRDVKQRLSKINEAINNWETISASTALDSSNVKLVEKRLNFPLENLIIKQIEILPAELKRNYYIQEAEIERRRIAAEREKQRLEAERERQRIAAEREKQRLEAERERQRIAAEKERQRIETEKERQRIAAQNKKKREARDVMFRQAAVIAFPALIIFIIIVGISRRRQLQKEKERQRIEAAKEKERLEAERERQRIADEKAKKELIDKFNQSVSNYEKKYQDKFDKYQNKFNEIIQTIETEEKELIELKSRHPKVETIVSSRQLGDSSQKTIKDLKKLLAELNDLN